MNVQNQQGQQFILGDELGKGGEARVLGVQGQPDVVAKLYHQPTPQREAKLLAMVANPPNQPSTHTAIAWPTELLYLKPMAFSGFLMPKVTDSGPIFNFYNPVKRKELYPDFTWLGLHRTARNLVAATQAIHAKNYVIGDINESNFLVNRQALVTLVDTDSFQVTDLSGQIHRCNVGKPEYTPPELQGVSFKTIDQQIEHDLFRLGVLIFQLLMEGYHPFAGVLPNQLSVGRVDLYCIKQGLFPYGYTSPVTPPPHAPMFEMLHPWVKAAFTRCFVEGHATPSKRPTAKEWHQILIEAENALIPCPDHSHHVYSNHLSYCPWCALSNRRQKAVFQSMILPLSPPSLIRAVPRKVSHRLNLTPIPTNFIPSGVQAPTVTRTQLTPLEMYLSYGKIWVGWILVNMAAWAFFQLADTFVFALSVVVGIVVDLFSYGSLIIILGYGYGIYLFMTMDRGQDRISSIFTNLLICFSGWLLVAALFRFSQNFSLTAIFTTAMYGLTVSLVQWQLIRKWLPDGMGWIALNTEVWAFLGIIFAFGLLPYHWLSTSIMIGTAVGFTQWLVLRQKFQRSGGWILASVAGWLVSAAIGWLPMGSAAAASIGNLTSKASSLIFMQEIISSGAIYGIISGTVLVWLLQKPKP